MGYPGFSLAHSRGGAGIEIMGGLCCQPVTLSVSVSLGFSSVFHLSWPCLSLGGGLTFSYFSPITLHFLLLDMVSEDRWAGPCAASGYVFSAQPHRRVREHLLQHPNIKHQAEV